MGARSKARKRALDILYASELRGEEPITGESLLRAPEAALQALAWAIVALALALLVLRLG